MIEEFKMNRVESRRNITPPQGQGLENNRHALSSKGNGAQIERS